MCTERRKQSNLLALPSSLFTHGFLSVVPHQIHLGDPMQPPRTMQCHALLLLILAPLRGERGESKEFPPTAKIITGFAYEHRHDKRYVLISLNAFLLGMI